VEVGRRRAQRTELRPRLVGAAGLLLVCVVGLTADTTAQTRIEASDKAPTVLFMCPHGAAKSVLASAYFQREAKARGMNVRVESAGTDPDAQVSSAVVSHLKKNGYEVPVARPRRATADDMELADVVIFIGCDLKDLPTPRATLQRWDDAPALSDDFAAADTRIKQRVLQLIDELVRQKPRQ
jgi:arsenate reductase